MYKIKFSDRSKADLAKLKKSEPKALKKQFLSLKNYGNIRKQGLESLNN